VGKLLEASVLVEAFGGLLVHENPLRLLRTLIPPQIVQFKKCTFPSYSGRHCFKDNPTENYIEESTHESPGGRFRPVGEDAKRLQTCEKRLRVALIVLAQQLMAGGGGEGVVVVVSWLLHTASPLPLSTGIR